MRSKPASQTSHAAGSASSGGAGSASGGLNGATSDDAERGRGDPAGSGAGSSSERGRSSAAAGKDPERARGDRGTVEVELEISRQRSIGWTIFGVVLGGLLVWKLGTVGVWVGITLIALGAYHAWNLVQTLRHPPGTIIVTDRDVTLPRGPCLPDPVVVARQEVTSVYFLRRSVPWNHAAPVLIVELGARAMAFPRDWFASEADQRHVIHALLRDRPAAAAAASGDSASSTSDATAANKS